MTEEYDIDFEYDNPYEDAVYDYDTSYYDFRDFDKQYREFYACWIQDELVYLIHLDIGNNDYYYIRISYYKTKHLEIGKKKEVLLQINNSPFDRDYFLIYDGEKISPKSRNQFISKIEHLLKLKNFL